MLDRPIKLEDRNRGGPDSVAPSSGTYNHVKSLAFSNDAYIAAIATAGISGHLMVRLGGGPGSISKALLILVLGLGGSPLLWRLVRRLIAFEFGSDLLAGVAIVASALMGEYLVGSIIVLMLSGGAALEQYATRRASSVLEALARRVPQVAHRRAEDGFADISLDEVRVGDALVVLPHEICPADGVVVDGRGFHEKADPCQHFFLNNRHHGRCRPTGGAAALCRLPFLGRFFFPSPNRPASIRTLDGAARSGASWGSRSQTGAAISVPK